MYQDIVNKNKGEVIPTIPSGFLLLTQCTNPELFGCCIFFRLRGGGVTIWNVCGLKGRKHKCEMVCYFWFHVFPIPWFAFLQYIVKIWLSAMPLFILLALITNKTQRLLWYNLISLQFIRQGLGSVEILWRFSCIFSF